MKVWGKEVNKCEDCEYAFINSYEDWECAKEPLKWGTSVDKYSIHKDCPFSKPITPEVIESYGGEVAHIMEAFKEDILFWFKDKKYLVHIHNHDRIVPLLIITDTEKCCNIDVFKGIINNPVELEFILKSLGIIE